MSPIRLKVVRPFKPFDTYDSYDTYNMTYFDMLIKLIREIGEEKFEEYYRSEEAVAKNFIKNGDMTRIIISETKYESGKYEYFRVVPVAYVKIEGLKTRAPSFLIKDQYEDFKIPFEELFVGSNEIDQFTHIYINHIAVKKGYKDEHEVEIKIAEAIIEIVESLSVMPADTYLCGSEAGIDKLYKLFDQNTIGLNHISSWQRNSLAWNDNKRSLYCVTTEDFLNQLKIFAKGNAIEDR